MNICEVNQKFATDEKCLAYIQQMSWPDGVIRCPACGTNEVKRYERSAEAKSTKNKRGWFMSA